MFPFDDVIMWFAIPLPVKQLQYTPEPLQTKWTDVLPQDIAMSGNHEIRV